MEHPTTNTLFYGMLLTVASGIFYMGCYTEDTETHTMLLGEKVIGREVLVNALVGVVLWHPQVAYTCIQKYLQHEWPFVQWLTPRVFVEFHLLEETLWRDILTVLFKNWKQTHQDGKTPTFMWIRLAWRCLNPLFPPREFDFILHCHWPFDGHSRSGNSSGQDITIWCLKMNRWKLFSGTKPTPWGH